LWLKIAIPALGFFALLAISIYLLRDSLIVSPFEKNIKNIETILTRSTKIPAIQGHQQKMASQFHPEEIPLGAEWSFKSVLFSSRRKHIPIEEIPFLFSRVLNSTDSKIVNIPFISGHFKARDLLIEREKYRMEKTYYRFFSQIISKIQEEKNDS
jgi:hypothetical protein